jgi:hypothetical protein
MRATRPLPRYFPDIFSVECDVWRPRPRPSAPLAAERTLPTYNPFMKAFPKASITQSRQVDELRAWRSRPSTEASSYIRFAIPDRRTLFATIDGLSRGLALPRAVAISTKRIIMRPGSFYDVSHRGPFLAFAQRSKSGIVALPLRVRNVALNQRCS